VDSITYKVTIIGRHFWIVFLRPDVHDLLSRV
jgi:hypothetical protein